MKGCLPLGRVFGRKEPETARAAVTRRFFGHMISGYIIKPDGSTTVPVTIPIGVLRIWNNGASLEWVYRNNWYGFDQAILCAQGLNSKPLYVLAGEVDAPLPSVEKWREFVEKAVERAAGRIPFWQPLNEPVYMAPRDPVRALALAAEAYRIIKARSPGSIVLSPSLNELQTEYSSQYADDYLGAMSREPLSADVISFHSYADSAQGIVRDLNTLRSLMRKHGIERPIWLTEAVTTSESLHALAAEGVACVVHNAQIAGADDLDASTEKGLAWKQAYGRMVA